MVAATARKPSMEEFVTINAKASLAGHSVAWIAHQLNLKPAQVSAQRAALKAAGVPLPELRRGRVSAKLEEDHVIRLKNMIETIMGTTPKKVTKKKTYALSA